MASLIDKNAKKCAFLTEVQARLGLKNVKVMTARVNGAQSELIFDDIVARALCSLSELVVMVRPWCRQQTRILAMKGQYPDAELAQLDDTVQVLSVEKLVLPQQDFNRHLVRIQVI